MKNGSILPGDQVSPDDVKPVNWCYHLMSVIAGPSQQVYIAHFVGFSENECRSGHRAISGGNLSIKMDTLLGERSVRICQSSLKIPVSAVRFCPWPPQKRNRINCLQLASVCRVRHPRAQCDQIVIDHPVGVLHRVCFPAPRAHNVPSSRPCCVLTAHAPRSTVPVGGEFLNRRGDGCF